MQRGWLSELLIDVLLRATVDLQSRTQVGDVRAARPECRLHEQTRSIARVLIPSTVRRVAGTCLSVVYRAQQVRRIF